jgi:hypothetical protein
MTVPTKRRDRTPRTPYEVWTLVRRVQAGKVDPSAIRDLMLKVQKGDVTPAVFSFIMEMVVEEILLSADDYDATCDWLRNLLKPRSRLH